VEETDLAEKLMSELPDILNWAVQGYLDWQEHGSIKVPKASIARDIITSISAVSFLRRWGLSPALKVAI
jgi:phage/plasmid-associated DNA primase